MVRFQRILLPTDFGLNAEYAARYARALARRTGGVIELIHVVDNRPNYSDSLFGFGPSPAVVEDLIQSAVEHAQSRMDHAVEDMRRHGMEASGGVVAGAPGPTVADRATASGADVIVIGTHGKRGLERLMLGSTCEQVIRLSPVPVLSIKHPEHEFVQRSDEHIELERVLCPCDFSEFSRKALPYAAELCRAFDATLLVEHVVHPVENYTAAYAGDPDHPAGLAGRHALAALEELVEPLKDLHSELNVRSGSPAAVIADTAAKENIDLIVMTTHGRAGFVHALLGSVAEKVVRMAPCPVLTIRPLVVEAPKGDLSPERASA